MAEQKQGTGTAGPTETKFITKVQKVAAGWSPELRGYICLGVGIFLFLFSLGYFEFLKVVIGLLGFALIVWGTIRSKLIAQVTSWFDKLSDKF